jgi:hypothetical protein
MAMYWQMADAFSGKRQRRPEPKTIRITFMTTRRKKERRLI